MNLTMHETLRDWALRACRQRYSLAMYRIARHHARCVRFLRGVEVVS